MRIGRGFASGAQASVSLVRLREMKVRKGKVKKWEQKDGGMIGERTVCLWSRSRDPQR